MLSLNNSINVRLFEFVNGAVGYYRPLDIFFVIVTSYILIWMVALVVTGYLVVYIPLKERGMGRLRKLKDAFMMAVAVFITYIIVTVTKVLVAFPRPFEALKHIHVLVTLPDSYSFPSGHAALTMALATAVYGYHKRLGELLFAFAFAVGMARIYVGVHYPLDVGVGFLIGFAIPKLLHHYFVKRESLKLQ